MFVSSVSFHSVRYRERTVVPHSSLKSLAILHIFVSATNLQFLRFPMYEKFNGIKTLELKVH